MFDVRKFGANLSKLRKQADMTQSELADRLNISRQAVSKYECGDSFPDITIVSMMSEIFGVSADSLISGGDPTAKEAALLKKAAEGIIPDEISVDAVVSLAPLFKPSLLDKMAKGLAGQGIDISAIVRLAEYLSDESVMKLLENATFETLDEELLSRLIPFLDENSKAVIFEKILAGELDYRFIKILLPYAEYLTSQIEAAVVYGALDKEVLTILNDYFYKKYGL